MFFLGVRLAIVQGLMLLMSYSPQSAESTQGVGEVMKQISGDPMVSGVEEARFWQVHYGLCMANLKLRVRGEEMMLGKLRERINQLVKNRLGGGYGKGGAKWEVTTQFTMDAKS